jgi:uncharacterized ferredoxin-like protein
MPQTAEVLRQCCALMELAARTAPKSAGKDYIVTVVLDREQTHKVGEKMGTIGQKTDKPMFVRDGKSVLSSDAMLLVGVKDAAPVGLDCGACGFESCKRMLEAREKRKAGPLEAGPGSSLTGNDAGGALPGFSGPICAFRLLDMGIALGSAAKTASLLNADNRIMYRAGVVALGMGLTDADCVMAMPLSATGKSVFFDR